MCPKKRLMVPRSKKSRPATRCDEDGESNWIPATPSEVPPSGWVLVREAKSGKDYWVDPRTLRESALRTPLTDAQMERIRRVALTLQEHDPSPVESGSGTCAGIDSSK
jgi:hypothetical protein